MIKTKSRKQKLLINVVRYILVIVFLFTLSGCSDAKKVECSFCNKEIDVSSQFCSFCGEKVPEEVTSNESVQNSENTEAIFDEETEPPKELTIDEKIDLATEYINNGKFQEAMVLLNTIGDSETVRNLKKECEYCWATQDLDNGYKKEAYIAFCMLGDYKDSAEIAKTACVGIEPELYELGTMYYSYGDFEEAQYCFAGAGDYEDAQSYLLQCETMLRFAGVYKSEISKVDYCVIDGNILYLYGFSDEEQGKATCYDFDVVLVEHDGLPCLISVHDQDKTDKRITRYYLIEEDGVLKINDVSQFDYSFDDGYWYKENTVYTKRELDERYAKSMNVPVPTIGMTRDEVRNSTWGEPTDINTTTYAWGTTEQWVYPGYRYIYFENGVVIAISE